jgi:uncharacterized protein
MTGFVLHTVDQCGRARQFLYNNQASTLTDALGRPVLPVERREYESYAWTGRKSNEVRKLKIQLGLSCNYSCEYCSQRFVPHADQTGPSSVVDFIASLKTLNIADDARIEFWGGEPLVYMKTLQPLVEQLRLRHPYADFSIITNGSLLNPMVGMWLVQNRFRVAISHDGPGQAVRGPDPFAGAKSMAKDAALLLYRQLRKLDRISFNAMMHRGNQSRAAVQAYFVELTGDESVPIGEGGFIDSYDHGGMSMALQSAEEHGAYRRRAYEELSGGRALNFANVTQKIVGLIDSIRYARPARSLGQKCGADADDSLTVTLRGEVLTCQNVSTSAIAPNGESHHIGDIDAISSIRLNTARHWSTRSRCSSCPVLQLCKGSCMFLEGDLWDATCESAYSDNVALFAVAIKEMTGCELQRIEPMTGELPEHRQNVFAPQAGTLRAGRQIIPIAVQK